MRIALLKYLSLGILSLITIGINGQVTTDSISTVQIDSIDATPSEKEESTSTLKALFAGPPGKAFVYSLVLPGAGQIYNKRYWKLPFVYGAYGVSGYILWDNLKLYNKYDEAYRLKVDFGDDTLTSFPFFTTGQIRANRALVRKDVQRSYIALGLIYFITAAEAFVDRHLMSFDMNENLSLNVEVGPTPHGIGVLCSLQGSHEIQKEKLSMLTLE